MAPADVSALCKIGSWDHLVGVVPSKCGRLRRQDMQARAISGAPAATQGDDPARTDGYVCLRWNVKDVAVTRIIAIPPSTKWDQVSSHNPSRESDKGRCCCQPP